jgi:hypothetical protein
VARILDANAHFAGKEPKFSLEVSKLDMMIALNWYNVNKTSKDAEKYAVDYFKKEYKIDVTDRLEDYPTTLGWVCRIVSNGATLNDKDQIWFDNQIEKIKKIKVVEEKKVVEKTNVISIQDRVAEKVAEIAGEIEGSIDDYILSRFERMPSPYAIMQSKGVKNMHAMKIIDIFKVHRSEFDEVLNTKDPELKEGYSNFSKTEIKKLVAYCDLIITDAMKISGEAVQTRKPRKRKSKSPEQLVSKLKYLDKFDELKLTSVDPKDIIGAMSLWVYNTKTRTLGCYHAEDAGGLSIKGSSVLNYNETKSVQKKLRKPDVTLPEVIKGGKVYLRNALESIRAVEKGLTGRLNADTILVRAVK